MLRDKQALFSLFYRHYITHLPSSVCHTTGLADLNYLDLNHDLNDFFHKNQRFKSLFLIFLNYGQAGLVK